MGAATPRSRSGRRADHSPPPGGGNRGHYRLCHSTAGPPSAAPELPAPRRSYRGDRPPRGRTNPRAPAGPYGRAGQRLPREATHIQPSIGPDSESESLTRTASGEADPSTQGHARSSSQPPSRRAPGRPGAGRSPHTASFAATRPPPHDPPGRNPPLRPRGDDRPRGRAGHPDDADRPDVRGGRGTREPGPNHGRPGLYDRLGSGRRDDLLCRALAQLPHRAGDWQRAFRSAGNGSTAPRMTGIRQLRVLIWRQTQYLTGFYGGQTHGAIPLAPPPRPSR